MSVSKKNLEELEVLRTKLDVKFDIISSMSLQERHMERIGMGNIKSKLASEIKLKRKLTELKNREEDSDSNDKNILQIKYKKKKYYKQEKKDDNNDEEDSKVAVVLKRSKMNSKSPKMTSGTNEDDAKSSSNSKTKDCTGDFLSMYLAEKEKRKKKKSKNKKKKAINA
ncbi:9546_t:CDS:2 [Acaulospora morrowiae]|uniref:9546_t:CDS:1 n=1 Tax=Acaulospora morrowiae TaxID=94023 RepID=A0A9N9DA85_9GLOM|nr:9546_t:CDS:2 [Acaulospora morrowiae]